MRINRREVLSLAASSLIAAPQARYRVGITSNTRGGWEKDVFLSFREAREIGYRYVESFIHYFVDFMERPAELQRRMDDIGLRFVTISNSGPLEMHFEDPVRRPKLLDDHLRLVRFIQEFGCTHLKINLGPRRKTGTTPEDLKHIAETVSQLGRRTKAEGVKLAVHAHMWSQFENRAEIDFVLSHSNPDEVWFVLDTGHITLAGIDPVELTGKLGHRIVEFHLKDTKKENRGGATARLDQPDMMNDPPFFELGHGGVDFPAIKSYLDGIAWNGWLTVELDSSPARPPKESARLSKQYLERTLGLNVESL